MGLPSDVTPLLSMAGIWQPVDDQFITQSCTGILANSYTGNFTTDNSGCEHIITIGWQFCGFNPSATSITPVHFAVFRQQNDGTMKLDTASFVSDSLINGGSSVVVADFNGDGYPDIFLAAHNESPLIAMPSTTLLSNGSGGFSKVTLTDHVIAHDAALAAIDGVPTVITATFQSQSAGQPADRYPLYQFRNGAFVESLPPVLSNPAYPNDSAFDSIAVDQFGGPGKYEAVFGDWARGPGFPYVTPPPGGYIVSRLGVYGFNGLDIATNYSQIVAAYFNSRSQYSGITSALAPGNSHTYRVRADDFNHDGAIDAIGLASLWNTNTSVFPAAIQMLQNDGTGHFQDVSDSLASTVNPQAGESDYTIQIRDLDGSGIDSYASAAQNYVTPPVNQANYILVNDGTGHLYPAILSQFTAWAAQVNAYVQRTINSTAPQFPSCPKFVLYRTANGKYNFLALSSGGMEKNGTWVSVYAAVNIPLQIDFSAMYTAPMVVKDRNGSHLIRTFAGDDTIYSGNSGGYARIDGGLGTNTLVYSGPIQNYSVTHNADGTWTIRDNAGNDVTDTLTRIQRLQFSDTSVRLDSGAAFANAPVITGVVNGASFQSGIVPGSWVTIQGRNLSGVSRTWNVADFGPGSALPTSLSGVQVTFEGKPAAIYYVSPTQLNVQAPTNLSGTVAVQTEYFGASNSFSVVVTQAAPGLFTYQAGPKVYPAAIYNGTTVLVGDPAVSGSGVRKARPGDILSLYATGIEPSPAGIELNGPTSVQSVISAAIGSQSATVLGAALVYPGEFQINIVVPNLADGEYAIAVSVGSLPSQSGVVVPISQQ